VEQEKIPTEARICTDTDGIHCPPRPLLSPNDDLSEDTSLKVIEGGGYLLEMLDGAGGPIATAEAPSFCRSRRSKSAQSGFILVTPLSVGDQRISFVGTKPSDWYKDRPASEA
jgi:hypothetical protein